MYSSPPQYSGRESTEKEVEKSGRYGKTPLGYDPGGAEEDADDELSPEE